jgi:hypothetical protein
MRCGPGTNAQDVFRSPPARSGFMSLFLQVLCNGSMFGVLLPAIATCCVWLSSERGQWSSRYGEWSYLSSERCYVVSR